MSERNSQCDVQVYDMEAENTQENQVETPKQSSLFIDLINSTNYDYTL